MFFQDRAARAVKVVLEFLKRNYIGTIVILLATVIFFWPLIMHLSSYSEGGDSMFNAWTIARDQHCILGQGCPSYVNGNIFFPHKDTMLYSETQLSTGLLTLPLYFINHNPLFSNNVWTIFSFFLSGWFMYLLAKYLSKGNELFSVLAGLIFEFAPFRMASVWHLQSLSILYLPLAVLLILMFFETAKKKYLAWLLFSLIILFYASFDQMVIVGLGLLVLIGGLLLFKSINRRQALLGVGVIAISAVLTLPLAVQYMKFNKTTNASFSVKSQELYSSSVDDYFIPYTGTLVGKVYYHIKPGAVHNSYNLDSFSYHGIVLYAIGSVLLIVAYKQRRTKGELKKSSILVAVFGVMAAVGFVGSLGPLLKLKGSYLYGTSQIAIAAPYLVVDKLLPQIHFLRAVGRYSALTLFALCCLLAIFPGYLRLFKLSKVWKNFIVIMVVLLVIFEIMPDHQLKMSQLSYAYHLNPPKVYQYIRSHPKINNIIILASDYDYPRAQIPFEAPEQVLWAGYTNRNIFNGYSGYIPPDYNVDYGQFKHFYPDSAQKMKNLGLKYILVDKKLSTADPGLADRVKLKEPDVAFQDARYLLVKID